jgi:hypothetical protein
LSWSANYIYDQLRPAEQSAAYFSSQVKTGLRITGPEPGSVTVAETAHAKSITCRIPASRATDWALEILGPAGGLNARPAAPVPVAFPATGDRPSINLSDLKSWEGTEMERRGWRPERGPLKERVAGIFVTAKGWRNIVSWIPEATVEYVSRTMLPKVIESRRFQAVGLSRDGITEMNENPEWLNLVAQAHKAGLRVYMKPGDGELTAISERSQIKAWARAAFDVGEERRCDVVRMPWEAVLVPWTTASLCLNPRFHTSDLDGLDKLAWPEARQRIVRSVADRFSFIIDSIRSHAPAITIDLECADTLVLELLLKRHENLGVMYMSYGQYPRVGEYLDLYYCAARRQFAARRTVLETDSYYTNSITSLNQLKGRPYSEMYSEQDLELMRRKHRHLCNLPAEAGWSWGVNITFTEAKFRAICTCTERI